MTSTSEEQEEDFIDVEGENDELTGLPDELKLINENTKMAGFRAIAVRSPLKYNPKTGTWRFCWNPANPSNVTQQICDQPNKRGELRKGEYHGRPRLVSNCRQNARIKYYRFLVTRNPHNAHDAACPRL